MPPGFAVIDVWLADATGPAWGGSGGVDERHPDQLTAVGRELSAAVIGDAEHPLPCNLSHSGHLVVFAIARSPCITHLGVDLEMRRKAPRPAAFASRILAEGEAAGATDLVAAWTIKEAALKAVRVGLAGDPRLWRFDSLQSTTPRLLEAPGPWGPATRWAFARTDIEGPAVLAVAARLDTEQPVEVAIRSAVSPAEAARPGLSPSLCLTWSPLCRPTTS